MNVYFLLDRSGSMESLWSEAVGSINGYVEGLPNNTKITLAVFDTISYDVVADTTAKLWKDMSPGDYTPRGGTPLFDSAARMMQRALEDNPEKAVFVVMTDGEENSSKNFSKADVKNLIKKLEAKHWEVIFLGANFDKIGDQAQGLGIVSSKWMDIKPGNLRGMMADFAETTAVYASSAVGDGAINFSAETKAKAAGSVSTKETT